MAWDQSTSSRSIDWVGGNSSSTRSCQSKVRLGIEIECIPFVTYTQKLKGTEKNVKTWDFCDGRPRLFKVQGKGLEDPGRVCFEPVRMDRAV